VVGLFLMLAVWIIHWAVILPTALLAATPYVLIASAFHSPSYLGAVFSYYRRICTSFSRFWNEGGYGFTP